MTKLYPTCVGKLLLSLILPAVFTLSSQAQKMVTYDTTFGGWNAIVTEDVALQGNDSAAGIIFFPGIGQMDANIADLTVNGPHYLITNGLWDGSVSLGNGVHHPFIISLQPPASGYPGSSVLPKVQAILARYRIKRNSLYMTALSQGAWQANEFVTYEATPGDNTCGMMVKAIVNLEGVEPADSTTPYLAESYPRKMGHWAKTCGGRELWVEGSQDWRDLLAGAQNMCDSVPNSATYFMVTYGGGAHCCWNTEYEPSTTWTMPTNSNISEIVGQPQAMNVWQWMLRQGDTTMPASESGGATPPVVSAGSEQAVTLPASSITLTGTAKPGATTTVSSSSWTQVSGPNTATIGRIVSSLVSKVTGLLSTVTGATDTVTTTVSGLVAGTYVFELTASENNGLSSSSTVTVVVYSSAGTAPTVSAGKGQAITLPASSATLTGTATGNDGATITALDWKQGSGPATATIGSPASLSTTVTGMTVAGSYVFTLTATDNNGRSANGSMTVTVDPAVGTTPTPPTVSAGSNQTITLPTSSVTLTGTATANGGDVLSSFNWMLTSGPGFVKFSNEWAVSTAVTGMVAGTYEFELQATDNKGLTTTSSPVKIVVNAAGSTAMAAAAMTSQAVGLTDSTGMADSAMAGQAAGPQLYPNPVQDLLNIRLKDGVTGKVVVSIYNLTGNCVRRVELEKDSWGLEASIDVSGLPKGLYVVQVFAGTTTRCAGKFIKL
jgi:hypothetical protein